MNICCVCIEVALPEIEFTLVVCGVALRLTYKFVINEIKRLCVRFIYENGSTMR